MNEIPKEEIKIKQKTNQVIAVYYLLQRIALYYLKQMVLSKNTFPYFITMMHSKVCFTQTSFELFIRGTKT